jgi:hypothetical protein
MTTERTLKDWIVLGGIGGAVGFATGWFLKKPITDWKESVGFDPNHHLHHATIGSGIAMLGGLTSQFHFSPAITGFGIGLAAEDYAHHMGLLPEKGVAEVIGPTEAIQGEGDMGEWLISPSLEEQYNGAEVDLMSVPSAEGKKQWFTIPNWPPALRTKMMTDMLRKIIYEDAHHPAVRRYAEDIIREAATDGRDEDAILPAMQLWMQRNVMYVHDEAKAPDGSLGVDRFSHAQVTLPPSKLNPMGTGMGDCDDMVITFCSMCQSVGFEDVCMVLVDQGRGYSHIAPGRVISRGKPKSIDDVIFIELTEAKTYGWRPPAKKYGFVLL